MKVNSKMICNMDRVNIISMKMNIMKDHRLKIKYQGKEYKFLKMEVFIKVIIKMENVMALLSLHLKMDLVMKGTLQMDENRDREPIPTKIRTFILVNGMIINNMVTENIFLQKINKSILVILSKVNETVEE